MKQLHLFLESGRAGKWITTLHGPTGSVHQGYEARFGCKCFFNKSLNPTRCRSGLRVQGHTSQRHRVLSLFCSPFLCPTGILYHVRGAGVVARHRIIKHSSSLSSTKRKTRDAILLFQNDSTLIKKKKRFNQKINYFFFSFSIQIPKVNYKKWKNQSELYVLTDHDQLYVYLFYNFLLQKVKLLYNHPEIGNLTFHFLLFLDPSSGYFWYIFYFFFSTISWKLINPRILINFNRLRTDQIFKSIAQVFFHLYILRTQNLEMCFFIFSINNILIKILKSD